MSTNRTSQVLRSLCELQLSSNWISGPYNQLGAVAVKYQKMEEALNFYAQKKNYETESIWNGEDDVNVEKVIDDGEVARQALSFDPLAPND